MTTAPLPPEFLGPPIAHRAYHDRAAGRTENSPSAIEAAVATGYGIEIDVQLTRDGQAVVFHDYDLKRLTGQRGAVRDRTAADLSRIPLAAGGGAIPTLARVLEMVSGRVALLVEIKDQDGFEGPVSGILEAAVARDLASYAGPVAVMSFNPHSIRAMSRLAPSVPRGLVTDPWKAADWRGVSAETRARLRGIPDYGDVGASFISHKHDDLERARVKELKDAGASILCWTIRSAEAEARARRIADNVTFEGYAARIPAA